MFIINKIKKIIKSKRILFTTPTHLQSSIIPSGLKNLIGYKAYNADFSEVEGLDNLKHPENCIYQSQKRASEIYNTKQTFYLTNGSSSGILSIMLTVLKKDDLVLIARNTHESIFNALVLTGAKPVWFLPQYNEKFDIPLGITLDQVKTEYEKNKNIKMLIITSPTYEGMCSEIKEISEFCKSKNIFFFVDEAHGALFGFHEKLPKNAISLGADASVQSLHKNTPSLTGTALLHISKSTNISAYDVQKNLNLITTTSPSWLLITSIEGAINYLTTKKCRKEIDNLITNIEKLKNYNKNFEFFENDDVTKLLIKKEGFTGEEISGFLFDNNIEDELTTNKSVLCLCGIGTTDKKFKKLNQVLKKFNKKPYVNDSTNEFYLSLPEMKLSPQRAYNSEYETIKKENVIGRIIAENVTPYPPCIPVLMVGEVIEERHLRFLDKEVRVIK